MHQQGGENIANGLKVEKNERTYVYASCAEAHPQCHNMPLIFYRLL